MWRVGYYPGFRILDLTMNEQSLAQRETVMNPRINMNTWVGVVLFPTQHLNRERSSRQN